MMLSASGMVPTDEFASNPIFCISANVNSSECGKQDHVALPDGVRYRLCVGFIPSVEH